MHSVKHLSLQQKRAQLIKRNQQKREELVKEERNFLRIERKRQAAEEIHVYDAEDMIEDQQNLLQQIQKAAYESEKVFKEILSDLKMSTQTIDVSEESLNTENQQLKRSGPVSDDENNSEVQGSQHPNKKRKDSKSFGNFKQDQKVDVQQIDNQKQENQEANPHDFSFSNIRKIHQNNVQDEQGNENESEPDSPYERQMFMDFFLRQRNNDMMDENDEVRLSNENQQNDNQEHQQQNQHDNVENVEIQLIPIIDSTQNKGDQNGYRQQQVKQPSQQSQPIESDSYEPPSYNIDIDDQIPDDQLIQQQSRSRVEIPPEIQDDQQIDEDEAISQQQFPTLIMDDMDDYQRVHEEDNQQQQDQQLDQIDESNLYNIFPDNYQLHPKGYLQGRKPFKIKYGILQPKQIPSIFKMYRIKIPETAHYLDHYSVQFKVHEFIRYDWSNLIVINFVQSNMTDQKFKRFTENSKLCPLIKVLYLSYNAYFQTVTCEMLQKFKRLQYIHFGDNQKSNKLSQQSIKQIKKYKEKHPNVNITCHKI